MNRKVAKANLLDIKKILDEMKISFWLNTGTLLGAMREKNFIAWDHDVDLRVKVVDWKNSAQALFKKRGFRCGLVRPPYSEKLPLVKYLRLGRHSHLRFNLAFTYYYRPDDVYITWAKSPDNIGNLTPAHFYRNDQFIKFLGTSFRVPHDPVAFLVRVYGKKWKVPIKERIGCWAPKHHIKIDKYLKWFAEHPEEMRFSEGRP